MKVPISADSSLLWPLLHPSVSEGASLFTSTAKKPESSQQPERPTAPLHQEWARHRDPGQDGQRRVCTCLTPGGAGGRVGCKWPLRLPPCKSHGSQHTEDQIPASWLGWISGLAGVGETMMRLSSADYWGLLPEATSAVQGSQVSQVPRCLPCLLCRLFSLLLLPGHSSPRLLAKPVAHGE